MRQPNSPALVLPLLLSALLAPAQTQSAGQNAASQAPSASQTAVQPASDPMDEPLRPEELAVPTNAGLTAPPSAATPSEKPGTELKKSGKGGIFTLRTQVEEVVLHATVMDEHDRMIAGLDRSAFTVYEDGRPQPITSFRYEDVPVAVGILVDDSASMRDKRPAVTQAALNFVRASNPKDLVFVVNFSDQDDIYIDADFTSSIPKLKEALENIDSRGQTALYDAIVASADHVTKQTGVAGKLDKKVLLVITDGYDNDSKQSLEQAVRRVQEEDGPLIYTVGLLDDYSKRRGKRALKELAEQTGGIAYFLNPNDLAQVNAVTQQIAHDIRNQYILGYKKNQNANAGFRSVRVTAKARGYKDLRVRTRSGYFPGQEQLANQ